MCPRKYAYETPYGARTTPRVIGRWPVLMKVVEAER